MDEPPLPALVGIFVGGRATRMGGRAKGLLEVPHGERPGETIVERLTRVARAAFLDASVVLVGADDRYAHLGVRAIADEAADVGPLGGLCALLEEGARSGPANASVIALACDLPFVTEGLLARLGHHAPEAAAVAPRRDGLWEPLFARYRADRVLAVARTALDGGSGALHRVLSAVGAAELPLEPGDGTLLLDWDRVEDVPGLRPDARR